jgi:hypothetical protein
MSNYTKVLSEMTDRQLDREEYELRERCQSGPSATQDVYTVMLVFLRRERKCRGDE